MGSATSSFVVVALKRNWLLWPPPTAGAGSLLVKLMLRRGVSPMVAGAVEPDHALLGAAFGAIVTGSPECSEKGRDRRADAAHRQVSCSPIDELDRLSGLSGALVDQRGVGERAGLA